MKKSQATIALYVLLALLVVPALAFCDDEVAAVLPDDGITGVVSSSSPNTIVVKTASGQYLLFVYDSQVEKPAMISNGSTVNVVSTPGDDGARVAHKVTLISAAPAKTSGTSQKSKSSASADKGMAPLPDSVNKVEREVDQTIHKYGIGLEGGVGLDPEIILVGVNAKLGPIFSKDLSFRPGADFGFGEVTKMFQINLDVDYRLPITARNSPWTAYAGAGPNFAFVSQNFSAAQGGDHSVDFNDFTFKAGLNVNVGMESRSGLYYEMKASIWSIPSLRLMVGYHF
jgi:hypothetical protein